MLSSKSIFDEPTPSSLTNSSVSNPVELNDSTITAGDLGLFDGSSSSDDEPSISKSKKNKKNKKKSDLAKKEAQAATEEEEVAKKEAQAAKKAAQAAKKAEERALQKQWRIEQEDQKQKYLQQRLEEEALAAAMAQQVIDSISGQSSSDLSSSTTTTESKPGSKRESTTRKRDHLVSQLTFFLSQVPSTVLIDQIDMTAPDPQFLVYLKAYPGNIPVSHHWSQKRRIYSKNDLMNEKETFVIPPYIEALNARRFIQTDSSLTINQERRQMFKMENFSEMIDFQQWRDTFEYGMPPVVSAHLEDIQEEGKDDNDRFARLSPFDPISPALQHALGMLAPTSSTVLGNNNAPNDMYTPNSALLSPLETISIAPPWLAAMQTLGPPPAYKNNAYIPGVNAPLPPGAQWGELHGQVKGTFWGNVPFATPSNPAAQPSQTSVALPAPKWPGDLYARSPFMQALQRLLFNKYQELLAAQRSGGAASSSSSSTNHSYFGTSSDPQSTSPNATATSSTYTLTGAWYPRPLIPSGTTPYLSTQPSSTEKLCRQRLDAHKVTPKLFGAVDFVGFASLAESLAAAAAATTQETSPLSINTSTPLTATTNTNSTTLPQSPHDQNAATAWKQARWQEQVDSALGANVKPFVHPNASYQQPPQDIPIGGVKRPLAPNPNNGDDHIAKKQKT